MSLSFQRCCCEQYHGPELSCIIRISVSMASILDNPAFVGISVLDCQRFLQCASPSCSLTSVVIRLLFSTMSLVAESPICFV